ncbi:hypothetical protein VNI00_002515 [Paramarasmius palmivorus]|uniref:Uncharacterized protein n=1 Tax=Paramarasmius palmivorus TaxID=297713 RepID=A0AAW0DZA5_9AGAR
MTESSHVLTLNVSNEQQRIAYVLANRKTLLESRQFNKLRIDLDMNFGLILLILSHFSPDSFESVEFLCSSGVFRTERSKHFLQQLGGLIHGVTELDIHRIGNSGFQTDLLHTFSNLTSLTIHADRTNEEWSTRVSFTQLQRLTLLDLNESDTRVRGQNIYGLAKRYITAPDLESLSLCGNFSHRYDAIPGIVEHFSRNLQVLRLLDKDPPFSESSTLCVKLRRVLNTLQGSFVPTGLPCLPKLSTLDIDINWLHIFLPLEPIMKFPNITSFILESEWDQIDEGLPLVQWDSVDTIVRAFRPFCTDHSPEIIWGYRGLVEMEYDVFKPIIWGGVDWSTLESVGMMHSYRQIMRPMLPKL